MSAETGRPGERDRTEEIIEGIRAARQVAPEVNAAFKALSETLKTICDGIKAQLPGKGSWKIIPGPAWQGKLRQINKRGAASPSNTD